MVTELKGSIFVDITIYSRLTAGGFKSHLSSIDTNVVYLTVGA